MLDFASSFRFFSLIAYTVSITHGRCRALFIFSGGKAYRMPDVYLPRITEPRWCRSTGKRKRVKRETEGETKREGERKREEVRATRRATDRKKVDTWRKRRTCIARLRDVRLRFYNDKRSVTSMFALNIDKDNSEESIWTIQYKNEINLLFVECISDTISYLIQVLQHVSIIYPDDNSSYYILTTYNSIIIL